MSVRDMPSPCVQFVRRRDDSDCRQCAMRNSALFGDLRPLDIEWATRHIDNGLAARDSVIYEAGETDDALYTIRVGVVKLIMQFPGRESRIVRLLGRGATLGLERLAGKPYTHTAIALRTTNLCRIPLSVIHELHSVNPRLLHGLMVKWEEQVLWADRWIAILSTGLIERRLSDLVRLVIDISGDPLDAVQLPSVGDMAAILGITPESASRNLAKLKRQGLLARVAPWLYRCSPALLAQSDAPDDAPPAASATQIKLSDVRRQRKASTASRRRED